MIRLHCREITHQICLPQSKTVYGIYLGIKISLQMIQTQCERIANVKPNGLNRYKRIRNKTNSNQCQPLN